MAEFRRLLENKAALADRMQSAGCQHLIGQCLTTCDELLRDENEGNDGASRLRNILRQVTTSIDLSTDAMTISWQPGKLVGMLIQSGSIDSRMTFEPSEIETLVLPIAIKRRGVEARMVLTNGNAPDRKPDQALIRLMAKAQCYLARLTDGSAKSLTDLAEHYQTELTEISRVLPLAFLAPSIAEAILGGRQSPTLTARRCSGCQICR